MNAKINCDSIMLADSSFLPLVFIPAPRMKEPCEYCSKALKIS